MENKKLRLYCFPFAGGSAVIFNDLRRYLYDYVEVVPVEYAGRGKRFREAKYATISDAVDDLYNLMKPELPKVPYAILGYSFGALIIYEIIKRLMQEEDPLPLHAFFMACHAPHNRYGDFNFHELSDDKLTEVIRQLGGISNEVINHDELLKIFIPIIKNDFKLYEQYDKNQDKVRLPLNITVVNAKYDKLISEEKTLEWMDYAKMKCRIRFVESDHYFITDKTGEIASIIKEDIEPVHGNYSGKIQSYGT